MQKNTVQSGSAYEDRYGFARGVRNGTRIEIAGTAPIPPPGEPLADTPYGQMMRCGQIAIEALEELGAGVADVIRTRMFITEAGIADEIGRAHRDLFGAARPTSTMVVVALVEPDWYVELEVEAEISDSA